MHKELHEQTPEEAVESLWQGLDTYRELSEEYMKVTGKNQGEIKGSCDQGGDKKDKILVLPFLSFLH